MTEALKSPPLDRIRKKEKTAITRHFHSHSTFFSIDVIFHSVFSALMPENRISIEMRKDKDTQISSFNARLRHDKNCRTE